MTANSQLETLPSRSQNCAGSGQLPEHKYCSRWRSIDRGTAGSSIYPATLKFQQCRCFRGFYHPPRLGPQEWRCGWAGYIPFPLWQQRANKNLSVIHTRPRAQLKPHGLFDGRPRSQPRIVLKPHDGGHRHGGPVAIPRDQQFGRAPGTGLTYGDLSTWRAHAAFGRRSRGPQNQAHANTCTPSSFKTPLWTTTVALEPLPTRRSCAKPRNVATTDRQLSTLLRSQAMLHESRLRGQQSFRLAPHA